MHDMHSDNMLINDNETCTQGSLNAASLVQHLQFESWNSAYIVKQGANQHSAAVIRSKFKDCNPLAAVSCQSNNLHLVL